MKYVEREGIVLSYEEQGAGELAVLLLHGWGCDHTFLAPQAEYLAAKGFRALSPDLRGHGSSAAPVCDYTIEVYAEDLAFLCSELQLEQIFVIGHSMGGMIGLSLAARPGLVSGVVLIDSFVFPSAKLIEALEPLRSAIKQQNYREVYRQAISSLLLPSDKNSIVEKLRWETPAASQHVLAASLESHFDQASVLKAAQSCKVPTAYIAAAQPLGDVEIFRRYTPQLISAQTLGSGHFSPLQAPEQINAMLWDFLELAQLTQIEETL